MMKPLALACALACVLAPSSPVAAGDRPSAELRPLIGLEGGAVVACGFEADLRGGSTVILRLYVGRGDDGPRLVLELDGSPPADGALLRAEVRTGALSTALMTPDIPATGRLYRASAPAGGTLAPLFQQLFLVGGDVRLGEGGAGREFVIRGPVPAGIRASFLNCSGDLYRQER